MEKTHRNEKLSNLELSEKGGTYIWSTFKRGIIGVYHQTSTKHLHRYCNEYSYRYNNRESDSVLKFADAIRTVTNARITYKKLIGE